MCVSACAFELVTIIVVITAGKKKIKIHLCGEHKKTVKLSKIMCA